MEKRVTPVEKAKAKVRACDAEVDRLAARASRASGETRVVVEEQVDDLRGQCEALTHKLEDIQWSEEAWEEVKQGVEGALNRLKNGIERAKSRIE